MGCNYADHPHKDGVIGVFYPLAISNDHCYYWQFFNTTAFTGFDLCRT